MRRDDDEIRHRLADYSRSDISANRDRLIALWREHHPLAAQEVSPIYKPLELFSTKQPGEHPSLPDETWVNDTFNVTLRRHRKDPVFGSGGGMIQLGISTLDGTARHDWREFQAIKNQLAGAECEAFELYPADSRLMDPSNYYSLWCFPGVNRIKVGHGPEERRVFDADESWAPQRAFPKEGA